MDAVTSSAVSVRSRKRPEERREEILDAASVIAVDEGLERVTLRAVAERLGVRPGLITHYFPVAELLVTAAFARAAERERVSFFPVEGTPLARMAHFFRHIESGGSLPLARLWLNARHLSRFSAALNEVLQEQDALDRVALTSIIEEGRESGDFATEDAERACALILVGVDGDGSYVNSAPGYDPAFRYLAPEIAEWALGLEPGALRRAIG